MRREPATFGANSCRYPALRRMCGRLTRSLTSRKKQARQSVILDWLATRNADDFPYDAVVAEFHRVGKHHVAPETLADLDMVRLAFPELHGSPSGLQLLDRFLDTALDKWDERYANPTYLGLSLLPLPVVDDCVPDIAAVAQGYDRLLVQLIADTARFEIAARDGTTEFLPRLRPDIGTTEKRCRLCLRIAGPAARRLALDDGVDATDPIAAARRLWHNLATELSPEERRVLQLTMLPVSLIHDEYQFIRILQSFEATFALVGVLLRAAVRALTDDQLGAAADHIGAAATALREVAPLFSLVGTMPVETFHAFRVYTEGASAIQSRNYKIVESLCRRPDRSRLDSAAYLAVPEVRERVLAGQLTLDEAFTAALHSGRIDDHDRGQIEQAMRQFATVLLRWRRTHHRLAVRMLGEQTGTGYTEGASYLAAARSIPVFNSVAVADEIDEAEAPAERPPLPEAAGAGATRGRCPFAGH